MMARQVMPGARKGRAKEGGGPSGFPQMWKCLGQQISVALELSSCVALDKTASLSGPVFPEK